MKRQANEINAGSMADIAFLLLIFFLVTTTMDVDTGITRILPQLPSGPPPPKKERNMFKVFINKNDRLMVKGKNSDIHLLKDQVKNFILNPLDDKHLSEKKLKSISGLGQIQVSRGVVSLKNDRGTSYEMYIKVQNEITAAFNELRDELAIKRFGIGFKQLTIREKSEAIKKAIPLAISEAEPVEIK